MTERDWDAATYDRVSEPMSRMGTDVLDRLDLRGDERVLDAGCGTGRVTEALAERLPDGHVVALDASPAMIAEARRRLARLGERVEFVVADLARPLPIGEAVDAILSTAAFHWVPDHDALFANLAAVLRPTGRLAAQCGAPGNLARFRAALPELGEASLGRVWFPTPEETEARLVAAGFDEIRTWVVEEPQRVEPEETLVEYLETIILREHVGRLPPAARRPFVADVVRRLGEPVLDYVRLNIDAVRAG